MAQSTHERKKTSSKLRSPLAVGGVALSTMVFGAIMSGTSTGDSLPNVLQQLVGQHGEKPLACTSEPNEQTVERALTCERLLRSGRIAVVGYGLTSKQLSELAKLTQQELNIVYGTNVSVTAVPATPELTQIIEDNSKYDNQPDCTSVRNEDSIVSSVAKERMSDELHDYDIVIGISTLGDCNNRISGFEREGQGQFVDVLGYDPQYTKDSVDVATHEVGHTFGLGHAASFYFEALDDPSSIAPLTYDIDTNGVFNITRSLGEATFDPYGENCNIMGNAWDCETNVEKAAEFGMQSDAASNDFPVINEVQKSLLAWPEIVLGKTSPNIIDLATQTAVFSAKTGAENGVAQLTLDTEYVYDGWSGGVDGTYTKLAFTADCRPANNVFSCINIYLQNEASTVFVGTIESPHIDRSEMFTIKMHNQSVAVTFYNDTIEIKKI